MPFSPEVDRYVANAAPFAQPILEKIRKAYHKAEPDIEETIKWGVPFFDYKGVVGNMAAFKEHVGWGFWKGSIMDDPQGLFGGERGMGGMKARGVKDLPSEKVLIQYIRQALKLNEEGVKVARVKGPQAPPSDTPADLLAALKKNAAARKSYESFSPSQKREYDLWISEAKQEATRQRRLTQAVEWMAEGKQRNWKYMR
jgi:uncharacterized protein YdeI (YjbR/CyaY-like superfamily)